MKRAKTVYYQTRIKELSLAKDMKTTWSLINTLLGKGGKLSNITEINSIIYNDRKQIAEHLNDYFVNIGPTLAAECEYLSDNEDLHRNSTDVNSKFNFHSFTETNILKT